MADLDALLPLAQQVLDACRQQGVTLATAESCTGGLIVGTLTDIAGSSDVVKPDWSLTATRQNPLCWACRPG